MNEFFAILKWDEMEKLKIRILNKMNWWKWCFEMATKCLKQENELGMFDFKKSNLS